MKVVIQGHATYDIRISSSINSSWTLVSLRAAWAPPWWMASCGLRCKLFCSKVKKEGYIDAYDFSLADQEVDLLAMSLCKQLDHSLLVYHWLQLGPNSLETRVLQLRWLVKTEAESIRESLVLLSTLKLEFLLEDLPSSPVSPHRSVMICHGVKWYRVISILMTLMSLVGILQHNHEHCSICLVLAFFSAS